MATYKKILVEVGLADPDNIDSDVKRGILWAGRVRIGEWVGDAESGKLVLNSTRLSHAGMDVEAKMLDDAVDEALAPE